MVAWLAVKAAFGKALSFVVKYPWLCLCIALAIAFGIVTDKLHDTRKELSAERQSHADDIKSWQAKVREVEAARDRAATQAREASSNAQEYHEQLSQANSGLEQYIRDHRVQDKQCPRGVAGAGAGVDPAVPSSAPAVPRVAVSEESVRQCDQLYAYSAAAYQWANELRQSGLAVDGK